MYMALNLAEGEHEIRLTYSYTVSVYRALLDLCGTVVLHWCGVDLQKEKRNKKDEYIISRTSGL